MRHRCRICGAEAVGICAKCKSQLDRTVDPQLPQEQRERMLAVALAWADKAPWLDVIREPIK